jgi:hypothetical protein
MFFRHKAVGGRTYLQIVESRRDGSFIKGPSCLSLLPFSPQAGNCANLVLRLSFQQNQAITGRRNPAKFESATGSRKVPRMFSRVPRHYRSRGLVSYFLENNIIHHAFAQRRLSREPRNWARN